MAEISVQRSTRNSYPVERLFAAVVSTVMLASRKKTVRDKSHC